MSLFNRLSSKIEEQEQPAGDAALLTEDTDALTEEHEPSEVEILGLTEDDDGVLSEMLGGMHVRRYVNHRDLQYALEDAATTCERNWKDAMNRREHKTCEAEHTALVAALRDASKKAGAYATKSEEARKSEAY